MTTPSGIRGRVVVRVEDGVGKGCEIETPTASLYPCFDDERPASSKPYKPSESKHQPAPAGWMPTRGESVTWSKTGGVIFRVEQLTRERALIGGELLGVEKEFRVPFPELAPAPIRQLKVVEALWEEHDIKPSPDEAAEESPRTLISVAEPGDDWVEALIFSPRSISEYRRRFAKRLTLEKAAKKLRAELRKAKKVRPAPRQHLPLPSRPPALRCSSPGEPDPRVRRRALHRQPSHLFTAACGLNWSRTRTRSPRRGSARRTTPQDQPKAPRIVAASERAMPTRIATTPPTRSTTLPRSR
jgi:hypothetical protein